MRVTRRFTSNTEDELSVRLGCQRTLQKEMTVETFYSAHHRDIILCVKGSEGRGMAADAPCIFWHEKMTARLIHKTHVLHFRDDCLLEDPTEAVSDRCNLLTRDQFASSATLIQKSIDNFNHETSNFFPSRVLTCLSNLTPIFLPNPVS